MSTFKLYVGEDYTSKSTLEASHAIKIRFPGPLVNLNTRNIVLEKPAQLFEASLAKYPTDAKGEGTQFRTQFLISLLTVTSCGGYASYREVLSCHCKLVNGFLDAKLQLYEQFKKSGEVGSGNTRCALIRVSHVHTWLRWHGYETYAFQF